MDRAQLSSIGLHVWKQRIDGCAACVYDEAGSGVPCSHHSSMLDGIVALITELTPGDAALNDIAKRWRSPRRLVVPLSLTQGEAS